MSDTIDAALPTTPTTSGRVIGCGGRGSDDLVGARVARFRGGLGEGGRSRRSITSSTIASSLAILVGRRIASRTRRREAGRLVALWRASRTSFSRPLYFDSSWP